MPHTTIRTVIIDTGNGFALYCDAAYVTTSDSNALRIRPTEDHTFITIHHPQEQP